VVIYSYYGLPYEKSVLVSLMIKSPSIKFALFTCGKTEVTQLFFIVKDMNRNVILGKDWLTQNGVRLYFDLGCLRIGKCYVSLEEDIKMP
jgi:hypothetical protein